MRRKSHVQFLGGGRRRKALLLPDYVHGWLTRLRDDRRLVILAAAQSQRAADYVLNGPSCPE
jgi:antirestriction protein ArdC